MSINVDKIFYINLDRRIDRNEHFINQCEIHNIPLEKIERFKAIDGETYVFSEDEKLLFHKSIHESKYCKGLMGNQLSHFSIMRKLIENDWERIIVFQDDVILRNNFIDEVNKVIQNIPENAEIINIGFHKLACLSRSIPMNLNNCKADENKMTKEVVNESIVHLRHNINPCSLAYIITKKGAENFIRHFSEKGFEDATDHSMNDYLKSKSIFYGSSKILATGNNKLVSDIFISNSI